MEYRIFKILRPLNRERTVLIYDKTMKNCGEISLTNDLMKLMGQDCEIYVKGWLEFDGLLNICKKVTVQAW